MANLNPWDKDYVMPQEAPTAPPVATAAPVTNNAGLNPWDTGYIVPGNTPAAPIATADISPKATIPANPFGFNTNPDGGLQDSLNADRAVQSSDTTPVEPTRLDKTVQNQDDLYKSIKEDPKYAELNKYENQSLTSGTGFSRGVLGTLETTDGNIGGIGPNLGDHSYSLSTSYPFVQDMPPELLALRKQRNEEMLAKYNSTGQETHIFNDGTNGALEHDLNPIRTQDQIGYNPAYDPSKPTDEVTNPAIKTTKYVVDPPDRAPIIRMGYQVLQNIIGGGGDFITEGKLTGEGKIGGALPETVPSGPGEKFATDMATFIVGPKVIGGVARPLGEGLAAAGTGLASKAANALSPGMTQAIKDAYQTTLTSTGSVAKATQVATGMTKNALAGLAFGLSEGVVAPNDSQGLVSPEWIQKRFGVTRERANDLSMVADTPIIAGTLGSLGRVYNLINEKFVSPTVGGMRNLQSPWMKNLGAKVPLSEKTAGMAIATWLDPNLLNLPREDAVLKLKTLGDALEANGQKQLTLSGASKNISLDTPAAFAEMSKTYYKTAYGNLEESMGKKEFNDWVNLNAQKTSDRLFELRTSLQTNDKAIAGNQQLDQLFSEGADAASGGNLITAQHQAGANAAEAHINRVDDINTVDRQNQADLSNEMTTQSGVLANAHNQVGQDMNSIDQQLSNTNTQAQQNIAAQNSRIAPVEAEEQAAKDKLGSVITDDPQMNNLITQAQSDNPWAYDRSAHTARIQAMSEPTFQALKTMRNNTDAAYDSIAKTGAEGDPASLLNIIHETGTANKEGGVDITNPFLKDIADQIQKDPSFDNLYTNVKRQIQGKLAEVRNPDDPFAQTLYKLRNNIDKDQLDYLKSNGDEDVIPLVDEAKRNYIKYINTFRDNTDMRQLANVGENRLHAEKFPTEVGPGQGVNDFNDTFLNKVKQHLDGQDGGMFINSLKSAVKEGGGNIDYHISNALTAKSVDNLASTLSGGGKQDLNTLKSAMKDTITGMKTIDPGNPMISHAERIAANIETLQATAAEKGAALEGVKSDVANQLDNIKSNVQSATDQAAQAKQGVQSNFDTTKMQVQTAKDKAKADFDNIKQQISDLKTRVNLSMLKRFTNEDQTGLHPVEGSDVGKIMKGMFHGQKSGTNIRNILEEADKMGDKGDVIKGALKGTYIDYIADKLSSRSVLGTSADGNSAYRISEPAAQKMFSPGSEDYANLQKVFKDDPKVLQELEDIKNVKLNLEKKTIHKTTGNDVLGPVPRNEDPQSALNSAITLRYGPLNRTGSKLRRLTGALSVDSLQKVRDTRADLLNNFIADAKQAANTLRKTGEGISKDILVGERQGAQARGTIRAVTSNASQLYRNDNASEVPAYHQEMDNLK